MTFRAGTHHNFITHLKHAIAKADILALNALLEQGTDIETRDEHGNNALMLATGNGNLNMVNLLLTKGANINARNNSNDTALIFAASYGYADIVNTFLANHTNIDAQNNDGFTALMLAACFGHTDIVNALIGKNANPNTLNKNGSTALMLAAYYGHDDVVKLLLQKGVDKEVKNQFNHTAMSLAKIHHHQNILAILQQFKSPFYDRLQTINYQDTIPENLICPISLNIMNDPITVSSGATYDRESLRDYFASNNNPDTIACPLTRNIVFRHELENKTAILLKNQIEDFVTAKEAEANKPVKEITVDTASIQPPISENRDENTRIREKRLQYFFDRSSSRTQSCQGQTIQFQQELRK